MGNDSYIWFEQNNSNQLGKDSQLSIAQIWRHEGNYNAQLEYGFQHKIVCHDKKQNDQQNGKKQIKLQNFFLIMKYNNRNNNQLVNQFYCSGSVKQLQATAIWNGKIVFFVLERDFVNNWMLTRTVVEDTSGF